VSQIGDIRTALAAALKAIPGMQASATQLSNFTPPCALVMRGPVQYDEAMGGGVHFWTMRIQVFVAMVSDIGAQNKLDLFLASEGDYSVKQAIEADTSLGGLISDLHVTGANGEQEYVRAQGQHQQGGQPLLGSEFTVAIWL
jgi:hypothetical protein